MILLSIQHLSDIGRRYLVLCHGATKYSSHLCRGCGPGNSDTVVKYYSALTSLANRKFYVILFSFLCSGGQITAYFRYW
jgi:hypothetical protein